MILRLRNFIFLMVFSSVSANAMVFDMTKEKFGSYLRGTVIPSWGESTEPFDQSSGSNMKYGDSFINLTSYEFGFLYNTSRLTWRVGFELIQPPALSGVTGFNNAGTVLYSMNSQVTADIPKLGLEFNLKTWKESRLWTYAEFGYAVVTVQNSYTFTPAGTAQFATPNFREVVGGYSSCYAASVGFETLMTDSSTISFELGYRMLDFTALTQTNAVTNFQGAQASGAAATQNNRTTPRDVNMSGGFVAVNLRLWVY